MKIAGTIIFLLGLLLVIVFNRFLPKQVRIGAIWLMRWTLLMRYALLLAIAPTLLGVAALLNPYMLLGVLLAREPWTSAFFDIWVITWMSAFTVGLGIVIAIFLAHHASERLRENDAPGDPDWIKKTAPPGEVNEASQPRDASAAASGWPFWLLVVWWSATVAFPLMCVLRSAAEVPDGTTGEDAKSSWPLWLGLLLGLLTANVVVLLLALAQRWTLGHIDGIAKEGILPFEGFVRKIPPWVLGPFKLTWGEAAVTWLFGTKNRGFSWLLQGPGYTGGKTGVLLPGQAQLIIVALFSLAYYAWRYRCDLEDTKWNELQYPTAFFALVAFFILGWALSGIAYWADRYRISTLLLLLVWLGAVFGINRLDHYFDLNHRAEGHEKTSFLPTEELKVLDDTMANEHAFLKALAIRGTKKESPSQISLGEMLDSQDWKFPHGPDGKRTLVVVTASGGGIQAAAWTATVLTELDKKYPGFSQSVAVISSVSGGSVGSMYYLGLRGLRDPKQITRTNLIKNDDTRKKIRAEAEATCLEACAWGLAFPDLAHALVPLPSPRYVDRGYALESVWWNRMGLNEAHRLAMSQVSIRDLIPLVKKGLAPAIVFNATCVETGQRVLISPLLPEVDPEFAKLSAKEARNRNKEVSRPIDFLTFYNDALSDVVADPRISLAARLSATFSYVTPVTRPEMENFWKDHKDYRRNLHFCDGGYSDTTGLLTAVELVHKLQQYYRNKPPKFERILIVRIEPFPPVEATMANENAGFSSAFFGPTNALSNSRVSMQAERANLELELLQQVTFPLVHVSNSVRRAFFTLQQNVQDLQATHPDLASEIRIVANQANDSIKSSSIDALPRSTKASASDLAGKLKESIGKLRELQKQAPPEQRMALDRSIQDLTNGLEETERLGQSFPPPGSKHPSDAMQIYSLTFQFQPHGQYQPPLSWTLSHRQKQAVKNGWEDIWQFKLTETATKKLGEAGVPAIVLDRLKPLMSSDETKKALKEDEFTEEMQRLLSAEDLKKYGNHILQQSGFPEIDLEPNNRSTIGLILKPSELGRFFGPDNP